MCTRRSSSFSQAAASHFRTRPCMCTTRIAPGLGWEWDQDAAFFLIRLRVPYDGTVIAFLVVGRSAMRSIHFYGNNISDTSTRNLILNRKRKRKSLQRDSGSHRYSQYQHGPSSSPYTYTMPLQSAPISTNARREGGNKDENAPRPRIDVRNGVRSAPRSGEPVALLKATLEDSVEAFGFVLIAWSPFVWVSVG